MKILLAASALLAASTFLAPAAKADTLTGIVVDDPLHIFCPSCTAATIGGDDIHTMNSVQNFGFASSPSSQSGTLQLKVLITDNFSLAQAQAFATAVSVTGGATANFTVANGGAIWKSGGLDTFLGFNGSPQNPIGAFTGASSALRGTSIDGYYVLTANLGTQTLPGQADANSAPSSTSPSFSLNPAFFCDGCLIGANLFQSNGNIIATANSSFGIFNAPDTGTPFSVNPVPGPVVGAGLPGLVSACIGLLFMARRRRQRLA